MAGRDEMLRRQRALADFGDFVLDHEDLDKILTEACRLIAEVLDVDLAKVIEIEREANTGFVRAGVGWRPGIVGHARVSLSERSSEAYAIQKTEPVIINEIAREDRFEFPRFLRDHGVVALVNVPVLLPGRQPWGVLQVDARRTRDFDQEDIEFLKTYAMVLGPVIDRVQVAADREQARRALDEREEREGFLLKLSDAVRPLSDPVEVQTVSLRILADHLGLSRAAYWEIQEDQDRTRRAASYDGDLPPLPAETRISDFGAAQLASYLAGKPFVVIDTETDPRLVETREACRAIHVRAWIGVPMIKAGGLLVVLGAEKATAHDWTDAEVRLLQEVAERTWAAAERAGTEAALRESESRLRRVLDIDTVGVVFFDFVGGVLDANDAFLRMIGYTREELAAGKVRYEELTPAEWRPRDAQTISELQAHGKSGPFEKEYTRKDGSRIWILCASMILDEDSAVEFVIDVTQRRRDAEALRDSESRLTATFESVPAGLGAIDTAGKVILANAEYRRFMPSGVIPSRDPERGDRWKGWDEHGRPLSRDHFPGARALRGERVVPGQEMLYTDDDGREIWTNVATVPTYDSDGRVNGCVSVISDIDEPKRSAEALRESEERLRQFGEASQDVLWIRDAGTLQWTYLTPAFERIYGVSREQALAGDNYDNWLDLIVPEDRPKAKAAIGEVRRGEGVTFEYRIVRPSDGEVRWLRNTDFPIRDAAGHVKLIGGIGHDITEHRQLDERQKLLLAELQHRVRNILAMVRSVARRTVQAAESVEELGEHLDGRLASLARTQAMLTRAAAVGVDLETLIREELLAQNADEAAFTLRGPAVELAPKAAEVLTLAIHELATNATKYGAFAQPGAALEVRWSIEADEDGPDRLRLLWQEAGVTLAAVSPRRAGFGTELIRRRVPYELRGTGALEMRAGGVRAEVTFPLVPGESILATDPPRSLAGRREDR